MSLAHGAFYWYSLSPFFNRKRKGSSSAVEDGRVLLVVGRLVAAVQVHVQAAVHKA